MLLLVACFERGSIFQTPQHLRHTLATLLPCMYSSASATSHTRTDRQDTVDVHGDVFFLGLPRLITLGTHGILCFTVVARGTLHNKSRQNPQCSSVFKPECVKSHGKPRGHISYVGIQEHQNAYNPRELPLNLPWYSAASPQEFPRQPQGHRTIVIYIYSNST